VLVVDDDEQIRGLLRKIYERAHWTVVEALDGRDALRLLYSRRPDVVVLDVNMHGLDGWTTLERMREIAEVPVLMLTAHDGELEKVRALRAGADDYVTKPFGSQELLARTEALVRRAGRDSGEPRGERYDDGLLTMDLATRIVTVAAHEVALTPLEFRLLGAFARHPDHVLSAAQLIEHAWETGTGTRDQVKIYVGYLRRKLGPAGERIETVRGFGYRYRSRSGSGREDTS